jgi:hypothetical protein
VSSILAVSLLFEHGRHVPGVSRGFVNRFHVLMLLGRSKCQWRCGELLGVVWLFTGAGWLMEGFLLLIGGCCSVVVVLQ